MLNKILEIIKKYKMIESGDGIVVAVSGGPDSMCLLNNLIEINNDENIELNFKIYVAHVNHQIRKEADEESKYVKEFCDKNNIPFFMKKVDIIKIAELEKRGTEETGRKVRYDFLEEVLENTKSNKIAIAHNLNDKVETILMNIIRGTGTKGLNGIEPIRDNKFIRPLIEIERNEIENYCEEKKLNPKIDKSNFENIYTRNKVRNILIPLIQKEFNSNIIKAIDKLSKISNEEQNYLDEIVNNIYDELIIENTKENLDEQNKTIILNLKKFNKLNIVIKRKLILYTIKKVYGDNKNIEKIHIDDIIKLCNNNIGNKFLSPHKNLKIYIKNSKIFFIAEN